MRDSIYWSFSLRAVSDLDVGEFVDFGDFLVFGVCFFGGWVGRAFRFGVIRYGNG